MNNKLKINDIVYASLFAALTSVLGYITIPLPFSPVPITGQTLGVMLAGCILNPIQAFLSMLTFVLLGVAGAPVFSGGRAGFNIIAGPSGGYIIGFIIGAVVISYLKGKNPTTLKMTLATIFGGIIVIYIIGGLWLNHVTQMGLYKAVIAGAIPFIPGDLLKIFIAVSIGKRVSKAINHKASV
ncbi:biotin transporter BioY [Tepidibacter aestuarii]|uniref:biotin transporter BioY n=1 Tax=Tepidibacter aestuarii TaxID=2925782 RepID=UPI0020BFAB12|nr:biotin transporter BioY [Tepidibacter aestuarii]CAH2214359.1 Biotin transporter [Tepidibacter aestuarii]